MYDNFYEVVIKCQPKAYSLLLKRCNEEDFLPDEILVEGNLKVLHWFHTPWDETDLYSEAHSIWCVLDYLKRKHVARSDDGMGYAFVKLGETLGDFSEDLNEFIPYHITQKIDLPTDAESGKPEIPETPTNCEVETEEDVMEMLENIKNTASKLMAYADKCMRMLNSENAKEE